MPGLYIHIPFCAAKCAYCDFLSFSNMKSCVKPYMQALQAELADYAKLYGRSRKKRSLFKKQTETPHMLQTIYFGGGTPTTVPVELLAETLIGIHQLYAVNENAEITIEANPETVDYDYLRGLHAAGFNRISFGVQSFSDALLRRIGRIHSAQTAERAVVNARQAGFSNISIDLMFALPGQGMADWKQTLEAAAALAPEHISCYSLTLAENTPLCNENPKDLPGDDTDRDMYAAAKLFLAKAGYAQYELSNFAKPGYESRHNSLYWTGGDYIGAGLGAHSLLESRRVCNTDDLNAYLRNDYGREVLETLTDLDRRAEFMLLGLRMTKGVLEAEFEKRFRTSITRAFGKETDALIREGLLLHENGRFFLTDRGMDLSNRVFMRFLA